MNAVIYARYSSDNQREESIEGQLRECKEYADQNGITVVRTYIDRALSAKTDSRPQFQQMIHDSATHTFEAVLVWKLDRFSRNRYDSAHYKRILKNNRVHVVSVTEPISNTPEGIMLESLLEGMAEYYSAELAEKVSRGHKENALKAKFNGGPVPLGYRIDSEHHYQIDPTTAPVVQEAFQRYAAGESIRSIIESLNARGIRNSRGNRFTKNSFQTLLKNRRYLGEYRYKDTVIPDAIPAIIDPECFDAVQRRCEIHRQAPAHNKADVHYLLTTKLFCGKCGTMMAGEYQDRMPEDQPYYYYACGESVDKIAKLPQVERILDKGYEILYCTEDVDDFVMQALGEIDGKKFMSATAEDALPQTDEEKKQAEEKAEAGKPVLEAVKNVLGDQVKEVRISKILKSGACCLSADGPVSLEMERYMRKLEGGEHMKAQRVLELNADSAPYAALKKAVDAGDQSTVEKYSKLLYGQVLLLADLPLEDPAGYAELVCSLMV